MEKVILKTIIEFHFEPRLIFQKEYPGDFSLPIESSFFIEIISKIRGIVKDVGFDSTTRIKYIKVECEDELGKMTKEGLPDILTAQGWIKISLPML